MTTFRAISLFGFSNWLTSQLASPVEPLPLDQRQNIVARARSGLEQIAMSEQSGLDGWRDLSDAMNWLQSCVELRLAQDPHGAILDAKAALLEAHAAWAAKGQVRMSGASMSGMNNLVEQLEALMGEMNARQFWSVVGTTQKRVNGLLKGKKRKGDVVVML